MNYFKCRLFLLAALADKVGGTQAQKDGDAGAYRNRIAGQAADIGVIAVIGRQQRIIRSSKAAIVFLIGQRTVFEQSALSKSPESQSKNDYND